MPTSQNGFYASPDLLVGQFKVPGTDVDFPAGIAPFASDLLLWVAEQIHERVERLRDGWCWGFYYRGVTGATSTLSNHASGTAIDVNAPLHGYGVRGSWSSWQVAAIRAILAEANRDARVIAWGEDFPTCDGMHFECRGTKEQVMAAGKRLTTRDWFDMASKADLEAVVKSALAEMEPTLQRIAQEAVQAELGDGGSRIWAHKMSDPDDSTRVYSAGDWLRGRNKVRDQIIAAVNAARDAILAK